MTRRKFTEWMKDFREANPRRRDLVAVNRGSYVLIEYNTRNCPWPPNWWPTRMVRVPR